MSSTDRPTIQETSQKDESVGQTLGRWRPLAQGRPLGKPGTKSRSLHRLRGACREKAHRARLGANPDFLCTGVDIKPEFLLHLGIGVARGKDFDADFRRAWKADLIAQLTHAIWRSPGHIGGLHAVRRRAGALSQNAALRQKSSEQVSNFRLAASMSWCGGWAHDDVTVAVSLNSAFELCQFAVVEEFGPSPQIKGRLHFVVWQFDRQRCHKYSLLLRCLRRQALRIPAFAKLSGGVPLGRILAP